MFLLLCLGTLEIYPQVNDLVFQHLTRRNGLPVNNVSCLAQDSSGFIWIGTSSGLYRYDGLNFRTYVRDVSSEKGLSSSLISSLCVTTKGILCVGTYNGGIVFMNNDGQVLDVINSSVCDVFSQRSNAIHDIHEDRKGMIWASTDEGLYSISADRKTVRRFMPDAVAIRKRLFGFFFDKNDDIWIGTDVGLKVFDTKNLVFTDISAAPYGYADMKNESTFSGIKLYNGKLWFSTWWPNIGFCDTSSKIKTCLFNGRDSVNPDYPRIANVFYTDSKNTLWMGTGKGLFRQSPADHPHFQAFFHETGNPYSIIGNNIRAILEDRDGNFWFGTSDGISIARPYHQWIHNLSVNNLSGYPFGDKEIGDVIEIDDEHLLVSANYSDRLYLTDQNFNIEKEFTFDKAPYTTVWTHFNDHSRQRVILSTGGGILVYDKKTGQLKIPTDEVMKSWHPATSFIPVGDSVLWVSRFSNTFGKYNLKTGEFKEFDIRKLGEPSRHLTMEKDLDNNIWLLGSGDSPLRFDEREEKIVQRFPISPSAKGSLYSDGIYFHKDLGKYFLIGYQTKGISLYNKATKTFRHYSQADGLASDGTRQAIVARDGSVWMATLNGLCQFNPANGKFRTLGYEEGILGSKFEFITEFRDGRIVAGGEKGLVYFNPGDIRKDYLPVRPPIITDISVYGKNIFVDSLLETSKPLVVEFRKKYFSIGFISLQYNTSRPLEYACLLEGRDREWENIGNRRFISYDNIGGGDYTFRVRVRELGGNWVESKESLTIRVTSPYYRRWWFFLLSVACISAIVYIIFHYRLRQLVQLQHMRAAISSDLHDEIGSSLTSISLFSEMAKKDLPETTREEYLQRIGVRSRESIEKMSDIVWSINPDNDSLEKMLIRMKNYSTEMAETKDIAVSWTESKDLLRLKLGMEQRQNFYLLFKEVINNAIKHSQAKNIFIALFTTDHTVCLTVKDDGAGFYPDADTAGNGLKNIKRRAEFLKGQIRIKSVKGTGTTIEFHLPLK